MLSGIYQIYCKANGKYYIGSAKNIKVRLTDHKKELRGNKHANKHLQNAWNKYPESDFSFSAIYFCDLNLLLYFEQYFMDLIPKEKRFNIREKAESNLGIKFSDEARLNMSIGQIGQTFNRGRKHTIKSRKNMSDGSAKIYYLVTHPNGKEELVKNMIKFSEKYELSAGNMNSVARGLRKHHKGYKVRYAPNPLS